MKKVSGLLAGAMFVVAFVPGATVQAAETNTVLFASHFERGLDGHWLPEKFMMGLAPTDYTVVADGSNCHQLRPRL
jgi:hypothetical protein